MSDVKTVGDLTVNNGKGLMDTDGYIDSIINTCNEASRLLVSGQYLLYFARMVDAVNKLLNLKNGMKKEQKALKEQIESLQKTNNLLYEKLTGVPVEDTTGAKED